MPAKAWRSVVNGGALCNDMLAPLLYERGKHLRRLLWHTLPGKI